MRQIQMIDSTLCSKSNAITFRKKLEITRLLEKLSVDVIELPQVEDEKTDTVLVRTIAAFLKNSVLSVGGGSTKESIMQAVDAVKDAEKKRIRLEFPVSPVNMEYMCHKKPQKMLDYIKGMVEFACENCEDVEVSFMDATRAEKRFLDQAITLVQEAGASEITVCDNAGKLFPDDFAAFVKGVMEVAKVPVFVQSGNEYDMAIANATLGVKSGANGVKVSAIEGSTDLAIFGALLQNTGNDYGVKTNLKYTELRHTVDQILRLAETDGELQHIADISEEMSGIVLDADDDKDTVLKAVAELGYDLSEDDKKMVYEEFLSASSKKQIDAKELDAIVMSVALQVPATYKLVNYFVNNGNVVDASAQVTLVKGGENIKGSAFGNGPIAASFMAVEQVVGCHYELDDFQIRTISEGQEAMGSAVVKLRSNGKLYSGHGLSNDIIEASIRAFVNAINKIVYEEE